MRSWKHSLFRIFVGCVVAVGAPTFEVRDLALAVPPVLAEHVPGATYTGRTPAGGSVTVVVTPDGSAVSGVTVNDIRSQNCPNVTLSFEQTSYQPAGLAPIHDHRFSKALDGGAIEGTFAGTGRAEGTVRWNSTSSRDGSNRPCETGQLSWTASTTAQAPVAASAAAETGSVLRAGRSAGAARRAGRTEGAARRADG